MRIKLLPILFALATLSAVAQNEANIWYFGNGAGIDFNQGGAVPLTNSVMNTNEGCATISDCNGNLLFYTDGSEVWDANHNQMPNGFGLMGDPSSSQSAVVVPRPFSGDIYYIFTVDNNLGADGLRYSEVDLSLNGGMGDVTATKNILLHAPTTEKITAVKHGNNNDIWVIAHTWNSNEFEAYLVDQNGVNPTPVVSSVGAFVGTDPNNVIGYIKASHDGNKVAVAHKFLDTVELLDFDNNTGQLSNPVTMTGFTGLGPYGVEFSPSNDYLYVTDNSTTTSNVYQYNITLPTAADIVNSRQTVGVFNGYLGSLQLAPNNLIYIAQLNGDFLSALQNPNQPGTNSDFVGNAIFLDGKKSKIGLPTFIQSYFINTVIETNQACIGDTTQFDLSVSDADSVRWIFGDPGSGIVNNTSTELDPSHVYSQTGTYTAYVVVYNDCTTDTVPHTVNVVGPPVFDLGQDQFICDVPSITLNPASSGTYLWSDGSTNPTLTVATTGEYWVEVEQDGCTERDTVELTFADALALHLGSDTVICDNRSLELSVPYNQNVTWSDAENDSILTVTTSGTYWVEVEANGCEGSDTIKVVYFTHPGIELGADILVCDTNQVALSLQGNDAYEWSNGSTDDTLIVTRGGTYYVDATLNDCMVSDTVSVSFFQSPKEIGLRDTTFCREEELILDVRGVNNKVNYLWSNGVEEPYTIIREGGLFTLEMSNICGTTSETIVVETTECRASIYMPNAITPDGDGINDVFQVKGTNVKEVQWQIFNRWGELLFSANSLDQVWDPSQGNGTNPMGVYVVNVIAETYFGEKLREVQSVTIIR